MPIILKRTSCSFFISRIEGILKIAIYVFCCSRNSVLDSMIPLSYKMTYYLLWKSAVVEIEPQRYWKHWLTCAHALKGLFVRTMLKACCVWSAVILWSNYKWQVSFLNSLILTILFKSLVNHIVNCIYLSLTYYDAYAIS